MDDETRAEFRELRHVCGKIFERIDGMNATVQHHVAEDATRFGQVNQTVAVLHEVLQGHERESAARAKVAVDRVEKMEDDRDGFRRFWMRVVAGVLIAAIIASGTAILSALKSHHQIEQVIQAIEKNGTGH